MNQKTNLNKKIANSKKKPIEVNVKTKKNKYTTNEMKASKHVLKWRKKNLNKEKHSEA
jgi:hypothetical protein